MPRVRARPLAQAEKYGVRCKDRAHLCLRCCLSFANTSSRLPISKNGKREEECADVHRSQGLEQASTKFFASTPQRSFLYFL